MPCLREHSFRKDLATLAARRHDTTRRAVKWWLTEQDEQERCDLAASSLVALSPNLNQCLSSAESSVSNPRLSASTISLRGPNCALEQHDCHPESGILDHPSRAGGLSGR